MQISTKITTKNIDVREDFWNEREKLLEAEVIRAIKHVLDRHAASEHFELNYDILVSYPVETPEMDTDLSLEQIADIAVDKCGPHRKIHAIKMYRELLVEKLDLPWPTLRESKDMIDAACVRRGW